MWLWLGLAALVLAFFLWPLLEMSVQPGQTASAPASTETVAPTVSPLRITYRITRWDLFLSNATIWRRNRVVQISIAIFFGIHLWRGLASSSGDASAAALMSRAIAGLLAPGLFFVAVILFVSAIISFTLKHRGVLCEHLLEVTDEGLIESTELNTTLHKWPSVVRIMRSFGYLFLYVGEMNSHQVPERCVNAEHLGRFENEVRRRATAARQSKKT